LRLIAFSCWFRARRSAREAILPMRGARLTAGDSALAQLCVVAAVLVGEASIGLGAAPRANAAGDESKFLQKSLA